MRKKENHVSFFLDCNLTKLIETIIIQYTMLYIFKRSLKILDPERKSSCT